MKVNPCLPLVLVALSTGTAYAHGKPEHGGQAVEVQNYQFELVVEPEAKATHLDFYIVDPKDKTVTNASAKLQIATPNGQKIVLPLKYEDGHYTTMLTNIAKGEYKVVALTTIGDKKLNSRFSFSR
jgi:uncharacterized protein (UPF0333 family)